MGIKLIIFDLDGTLVDSSGDIAGALNEASRPFGIPPLTVKETEQMIGGGLETLIERVLARNRSNLERSTLLERFLECYSSRLTDQTVPYPGVPETLAELTGATKAILSNKLTSFTVQIVERLGLAPFFTSIQGSDAVAEKKPAPTSILALLGRFATGKREAMIVGDSSYDIEAGRNAGIHTVAAIYGYGAPGFDTHADFRIHSFFELAGIVEGLS